MLFSRDGSGGTCTPASSLGTKPIHCTLLQLPSCTRFALSEEDLGDFKPGSRMQLIPFSPTSPPEEIHQHSHGLGQPGRLKATQGEKVLNPPPKKPNSSINQAPRKPETGRTPGWGVGEEQPDSPH